MIKTTRKTIEYLYNDDGKLFRKTETDEVEMDDNEHGTASIQRAPLVCNICGRKLEDWEQEDLAFDAIMGYGSKYDMETIHIQMCTDCLDNIVDKCALSPIVSVFKEGTISKNE